MTQKSKKNKTNSILLIVQCCSGSNINVSYVVSSTSSGAMPTFTGSNDIVSTVGAYNFNNDLGGVGGIICIVASLFMSCTDCCGS